MSRKPFDRSAPTVLSTGAGPWITLVFQVTALVAPLLSIYAPLGMAPLLLVSAAAIGILALAQGRTLTLLDWPLLALLATFLVWGALSSLWSLRPAASLITVLQLLSLFVAGAVVIGGVALLDGSEAGRIGRGLTLGMVAALVIYAIEIIFDGLILSLLQPRNAATAIDLTYSAFNRGLSVLVLLLAPAIIFMRRRGHRAGPWILPVAGVAVVYAYYGSSVALGLSCGLIASVLSFLGRGGAIRLIGVIFAVLVMAAPFVAREAITPRLIESVSRQVENISIPHRLAIWQFVGEQTLERPVTGWGLNAARAMPGGKTKVAVHSRLCQAPCAVMAERLPLHTHNMALQWWLELGLPGALLGAALLYWLFHRITSLTTDRVEAALLAGQLTAAAVIAGLSYGAWQSWWISTLGLMICLSLASLRNKPEPSSRS